MWLFSAAFSESQLPLRQWTHTGKAAWQLCGAMRAAWGLWAVEEGGLKCRLPWLQQLGPHPKRGNENSSVNNCFFFLLLLFYCPASKTKDSNAQWGSNHEPSSFVLFTLIIHLCPSFLVPEIPSTAFHCFLNHMYYGAVPPLIVMSCSFTELFL